MPLAEIANCNFPYTYLTSTNRNISTDIEANPSLAPPTQVYCVGNEFSPNIIINSDWYSAQYDTALKSRATSVGCLFAETTVNQNNNIFWITAPSMLSIDTSGGKPFSDVSSFDSFAATNNLQPSSAFTLEKSKYGDNAGPGVFEHNGNVYFKASAGVYCNASLRLYSTTSTIPGYTYNQVIASNYLGTVPTNYPKPNPPAAGTLGLRLDLAVSNCVAAGRTYINTGVCPSSGDSVYIYGRCTAFPHAFSSNTINVVFEPPFTCAPLPVSNQFVSNPSPPPSSQVTFGFRLSNNLGRSITITNIVMAQSSLAQGFGQLTNLVPSLPKAIPNTGQNYQDFTAQVQVPSSTGVKSIKVNITYIPTTPACNGQPNCYMTETQIINIAVTPVVTNKPDYIPLLTPVSGFVNELFTATITTRNQGNLACENWTQTDSAFNGNQFASFSVRPLGVNDQQVNTTPFTCPALPGNYTLAANVDSTNRCSESNESNNYATRLVECRNRPPVVIASCTLSTNHGTNYNFSEQGTYNAACFNDKGQRTNCTTLAWTSGMGTMVPPSTPPQYSPSSVFTAGSTLGMGNVTATGTGFSCSLPVNVIQTGQLLCSLQFLNHGTTFNPTDSALVMASCTRNNITEPCPAFNWFTNAGTGSSMIPPSTPSGNNPISNLSLQNVVPQLHRAVVASSPNTSCAILYNITLSANSCQLYPLGHNGNVSVGASWPYGAACRNSSNGPTSCPDMSWSTSVSGGAMVPPTTPPIWIARSNLTINASAPSPQSGRSVTATASTFSCSAPVNIIQSNIQIVSCGFENNHGPIFFLGESEWARAVCQQGGFEVPCPILLWSIQNLTQVTLDPTRTTTEPHRSLFSVSSIAPAPQNGSILVQCESPASCVNTCNASVLIYHKPVRMDCYLLNHSNLFAPGDWSLVQANCTDERIQVTACPELQWETRNNPIRGSSFNPNPTNTSIKPTTNFSISPDAPVPQYGLIDAVSTNPIVPGLVCEAAIDVSVVNIGPDYNLTLITRNPPIAIIGQPVKISVTTTNIGNQNATNTTSTRLRGEGCVEQFSPLPALNVGVTYTQSSFTCTCEKPGWNSIEAVVNVYQNQYETNYANNNKNGSYFCKTVVQLTCADFI